MPTEKKLTEPTEDERYQSMLRFVGANRMAEEVLILVDKASGELAMRRPDVCYNDESQRRFNAAEIRLPTLLTEVNRAVEVMNAALGGWIGGSEPVGPDWAALASANAALLEAAEEALEHGKEWGTTLRLPRVQAEELARAVTRVRLLRHGR